MRNDKAPSKGELAYLEQAHTAMRNAKVGEDEWFDVVKCCIELLLQREIERSR